MNTYTPIPMLLLMTVLSIHCGHEQPQPEADEADASDVSDAASAEATSPNQRADTSPAATPADADAGDSGVDGDASFDGDGSFDGSSDSGDDGSSEPEAPDPDQGSADEEPDATETPESDEDQRSDESHDQSDQEQTQPADDDGSAASSDDEGSEAEDDSRVSRLSARLQKAYQDVETFEADFEQTYRNRLLGRTRESSGHVWLRPPNKMRWEYDPPSKNLIVANGRELFVYEPDPNQVVRVPVSDSELPSVMAFLTGGKNLTSDYHVEEVHRDELAPRGQAGLELRPRQPSTVISRVVLVISRETGQVKRTVLVEPEGNTNTFVWDDVQTNTKISPARFTFTPPPDARVVER